MAKEKPPSWFGDGKLRKVRYADGYYGWLIDLGDGTGRYANDPLLGADFGETKGPDGELLTRAECDRANADRPRWGDRVKLDRDGNPIATEIVERYKGE